jgi:hypothetical protein
MRAAEILLTPLLLGLPGDNTFSNYQEANRAFWRQTVIPLVVRLQKAFQNWAQPGFGPFRFDYNIDRIDALASERAAEWRRIDAASFLTNDEKREAAGYGAAPKDASTVDTRVAQTIERRYAPDQPRVPAGSSEGGRWTSGGGGSAITDGLQSGGNPSAALDPCKKEWMSARDYCNELLNSPNPPRALTGGYANVEDCARGFVSAACGGNSV